jgi:hypothetical protein
MLLELLTNLWIRFCVIGEGAKEAFLYVISAYGAFTHNKEKMLGKIVEKCPDVVSAISDDELFSAFNRLCKNLINKNEILSPAELTWASQYIKNPGIRKEMEKIIYRVVASGSDWWDGMRREYKWTLSEEEKISLVREILADPKVGSKRKTELAKEFGLEMKLDNLAYFRKLLWDRHYDKAAALGVADADEIVISVIADNIDSGYIKDAADIAQQFIPKRKDIADEISRITAAMES